jgi:hypothetical protein
MAEQVEHNTAAAHTRSVGEAYMAWAAAESDCAQALHAWLDGSGAADERYFGYLAALDREEAAARDLQRLWVVAQSDSQSEPQER